MKTTDIFLTEDEFDAAYPLIPNPFDPNAGWANGEGPGSMFETYGEEFEFIRKQDPATVWTFIDGEDDEQLVISGLHYCNRIGYLVSTKPVPPDTWVVVRMDDLSSDIDSRSPTR